MLDVPLLYSPKVDISDLTGELNTLMSDSGQGSNTRNFSLARYTAMYCSALMDRPQV